MSKKIVVRHDWYGCDTGCCGTKFVFKDDEIEMVLDWEFDHFTEEEARREAEKKRNEQGDEWSGAEIELGDLRCFGDL